MRVKPPTLRMIFFNGTRLSFVRPIVNKCFGPPDQMAALLLGNTFSVVLQLLEIFAARLGSSFGENGTTDAFISVTWLPSVDTNVLFIWSNMIWTMSVFMGASSSSKLFITARRCPLFVWYTVEKWSSFPQVLHVWPHAGHVKRRALVLGVPCWWLPHPMQTWRCSCSAILLLQVTEVLVLILPLLVRPVLFFFSTSGL